MEVFTFFFLAVISFANSSKINVIKKFLESDNNYKAVAICGKIQDQDLEYVKEISSKQAIQLNCSQIISDHDSLMIFIRPDSWEIESFLAQPGSQKCLQANTWLIFHNDFDLNSSNSFENGQFKMGLNANLFLISHSDPEADLIQVTGTGTKEVQFKVLKSYLNGHNIFILLFSESWKYENT